MKLLNYFIRLLTAQTEYPDFYPDDQHSLYLARRKEQAKEQLKEVKEYRLPRKDQPLLPRIEPVPDRRGGGYCSESEDSLVAETVEISDDEKDTGPFGEPLFNAAYARLVQEGKINKGKVVRVPTAPDLPDRLKGPARINQSKP